jgi:hypothetical protein
LGLAVLLLAVGVLAVGLRYSLVDPAYQLLSQTSTAQGQSRMEVLGADGKLYTFTGDVQAATEWFRGITEQLDTRYHVTEQHQFGERLGWVATLLAAVGLLLVGVGSVAAVGRRRSHG